MPSVISGDANVSATEFGYLDGVTSALQTQMDSKLPLAGGKILQIVRATDSTERTTTSTSFVDVTGMSVTITPQKNDSALILMAQCQVNSVASTSLNACRSALRVTDSSNNAISGAEEILIQMGDVPAYSGLSDNSFVTAFAYATPATTSAVTYKLRFRSVGTSNITTRINNDDNTGQMYAIEVSA